jgi:hypothetical protein
VHLKASKIDVNKHNNFRKSIGKDDNYTLLVNLLTKKKRIMVLSALNLPIDCSFIQRLPHACPVLPWRLPIEGVPLPTLVT